MIRQQATSPQGWPVVRVSEIPVEPQPRRWLIEGLWGAAAVGFIGGPPKCCKSYLGLDLALSVATGTSPANAIFHSPNEITQKDFAGWVQERGLYFMSQWDSNFTPLLESHDPGEGEQKGGLLVAHYGKGTYIYTGYAFFRQLPAGVPGALRLFVNLVSGR